MSKRAIMSDCKNPEEHSDKNCCCGGHNANNPKKNKNHHATKEKISRREARKIVRNFQENLLNNMSPIEPDIAKIFQENYWELFE